MDKRIWRISLISASAVLGITVLVLPFARAQIQVTPNYVPIGVAASGNGSAVWFHQPSSGAVVACQAAAGAAGTASGIQCVAAKLP